MAHAQRLQELAITDPATGLDTIPKAFFRLSGTAGCYLLATFTLDATRQLYFPPAITEGAITYIHKGKGRPINVKGNHRPIRCTSHLGKVVESLVASPIVPLGEDTALLDPFQYAGRPKRGADQLAFVLKLILHFRKDTSTYIIFIDFLKAYDLTWRDGLWASLLAKGHPPEAVAALKALYAKLQSCVRMGMTVTKFFDMLDGIGQGSPTSTGLFTSFVDGIPETLRKLGFGVTILGLLIVCLFFMDDLAIPATTPAHVTSILAAVDGFCNYWSIKISYKKCGVLPVNVKGAPDLGFWSQTHPHH